MGENRHRQASSRLGLRGSGGCGGEIVEVHGGHIMRSTGRKDRHSKVCTAKGPRDRRVRLSAHTAIQFYDVQDRLGYDRPSKAVDWLINKAKSSIDRLDQLPAWNPLANGSHHQTQQQQHPPQEDEAGETHGRDGGTAAAGGPMSEDDDRGGAAFGQLSDGFLPPSLDTDSIADTIKSFFPMGGSAAAAADAPGSSMSMQQFQSYAPQPDLLSRTTSTQSQDLRLSLQSFGDPILLHPHQSHSRNQTHHHQQTLFSAALEASVSAAGWPESHSPEMGRLQRMVGWNTGGADAAAAAGGGGFAFASSPPQLPVLQPLFGGQSQFFSQRGPLQSSNTPSVRAWLDPPSMAAATAAEQQYHQMLPAAAISNPSLISGIGFASARYTGFQIPARIRGEEEDVDGGAHNKPSSASSNSRH